jgi:hypothetical protein
LVWPKPGNVNVNRAIIAIFASLFISIIFNLLIYYLFKIHADLSNGSYFYLSKLILSLGNKKLF